MGYVLKPSTGETLLQYLSRNFQTGRSFTLQDLQTEVEANYGIGRNHLLLLLRQLEKSGMITHTEISAPPPDQITNKLHVFIPNLE